MPTCPNCGTDNPDGFRFCGQCGTPLAETAPERRKTVTLLFCDVSGSTALGERLEAESVREGMLRYFEEMRVVIERHSGTVEKFVGDAVMAVFGVPVAHEDDALRAVRAASEMLERLEALNDEFEGRFGARIGLRIGINTGEVLAGDAGGGEGFVSGDAVNVAARLEQTAGVGEVLLGELTYRLARQAITAERVEPLTLKGKAKPVPAYRLVAVAPDGAARVGHAGTALVGREEELAARERRDGRDRVGGAAALRGARARAAARRRDRRPALGRAGARRPRRAATGARAGADPRRLPRPARGARRAAGVAGPGHPPRAAARRGRDALDREADRRRWTSGGRARADPRGGGRGAALRRGAAGHPRRGRPGAADPGRAVGPAREPGRLRDPADDRRSPRRAARPVRALAGAEGRRAGDRVRGDPRLPLRAGLPLPPRARPRRRRGPRARPPGRAAARRGRSAGAPPVGHGRPPKPPPPGPRGPS